MKSPFLQTLLSCLFLISINAQAEPAGLDYGDFQTQTLLGKAQAALGASQYQLAIAYAEKCIEIYSKDALSQQAAMPTEPTDHNAIFQNWALNDVGYCYLIKGQAQEKLGQNEEAIKTYKYLAEKLPYAKVWDPQGWFWSPATVADERAKTLEFSSL